MSSPDRYSFPAQLTAALLRPHLNSRFQVEQAPSVELELIEVDEPPTLPSLELFTLHFLGPVSPCLQQRIHSLHHATLGECHIFLTPISADESGTVYEAVFNRFRPGAARPAARRK